MEDITSECYQKFAGDYKFVFYRFKKNIRNGKLLPFKIPFSSIPDEVMTMYPTKRSLKKATRREKKII